MNFFLLSMIKTGLVMFVFMTTLAYLQWVERKVLAHIQLRPGPNRVGPHGLLQPLSDVIKLVTKEGFIPANVNKFFYLLAPILAVATALIPISMIPFGPKIEVFGVETYLQLSDLNIGVLAILAITSLGVYGIALAGWASNNKYALIGGLRSSAQMISYELPMAIAVASPLLLANSLSLREIVDSQAGFYFGVIPRWMIFQYPAPQFFAFILYLIATFAETNRIPFDLPEAENELVAGYHTEYSSMNFAAFFMAEYANMVTVASIAALLFLGGWHPLWPVEYGSNLFPVLLFAVSGLVMIYHGMYQPPKRGGRSLPVIGVIFLGIGGAFLAPGLADYIAPLFWFASKAGAILFLYVWVRGTLPRFRYDQLMRFAWVFMFPVSLAHLFITALLVALAN